MFAHPANADLLEHIFFLHDSAQGRSGKAGKLAENGQKRAGDERGVTACVRPGGQVGRRSARAWGF